MNSLYIGDAQINWLDGGNVHLDGGAMFGVVPKPLWSRKYECNDKNQIKLRTDPILIRVDGKNILVESGIGLNKMSDKLKKNFGVNKESRVEEGLKQLGLKSDDIDIILMTHLHFDHACGLTKWENDTLITSFKNAQVYVSETEWREMQNPNIRSRNTYWEENWKPIVNQVKTFEKEIEVLAGLTMIHTGGHSNGHSIITLERNGEVLFHLGDILPTHAHQNPLWVMAYDDYPMTSIASKNKWIEKGLKNQAWFTFYHDTYYRAIKWSKDGRNVITSIEATFKA